MDFDQKGLWTTRLIMVLHFMKEWVHGAFGSPILSVAIQDISREEDYSMCFIV